MIVSTLPRIVLLLAAVLCAAPAMALVVGQTDTFEDGTTQGWIVGLLGASHPAPPVNVPDGGPAGSGDNFLSLTALGGGGPGSNLSVINVGQWTGDYLAAGIDAISMDVLNTGNTDLYLRLLFADPAGGPPTNVAFSTDPIFVPAGSDWTSIVFPIAVSDLTAGAGSVATALANATEVRIFHNPNPGFPPGPVAATLGVDNIQALSTAVVPEPATMTLFGAALLALVPRLRRRET